MLNPDAKLQYLEEGYVILRGLLEPRTLHAVRQEMGRVFGALTEDELQVRLREVYSRDFDRYHGAAKLCNHLVSLYRLAVHEKIHTALKDLGVSFPVLCARPVVWFHSPHLAKTERYAKLPAHQEWANMQGSLDGIVVWAPLVDISEDMGRLEVLPGSHKEGLLDFHADPAKDYPLATNEALLEGKRFVPIDAEVGDVVFFSAFLVHRSGVNRTNRARLTVNFRFNNAEEPTFAERNYLNPFLYQVADRLITPGFPAKKQVQEVFRHDGN